MEINSLKHYYRDWHYGYYHNVESRTKSSFEKDWLSDVFQNSVKIECSEITNDGYLK